MVSRRLPVTLIIMGVSAFLLTACAPAPVHPVRSLSYPLGRKSDILFVFLPGRGDRDWSFEKHGLIKDARAAGIRADILVPDLHFGYYLEASASRSLHDDIILPARERGYRCIWLVGVSAGGLAAILNERRTPGLVSGMLLVAPYLGEPEQLTALAEAGGLPAYRPGSLGEPEFISDAWLWLQGYAGKSARIPPVFAGFGAKDKYAPPQDMLRDAFGPDRVAYLPGGHDWDTFGKLFRELLARALSGPLAGADSPDPPAR